MNNLQFEDCPDFELCKRIGRHIHGTLYERYTTNPKYKALIDKTSYINIAFPQEPGLMQKAVNFSKALVKHAATGFQSVSKEEQEERMNICKACSHFNKEKTSCYLCGCHLNTKTAWNESRCPDPQGDRWEKAKKERLGKTVENL